MSAGSLDHRVQFMRRAAAPANDPDGRGKGAWAPLFGARWARLEGKTGRETFQGRTEGRSIYELLIRKDPETMTITSKDRFQELTPNGVPVAGFFGISSVLPYPKDPEAYLLITAEAGGNNG